MLALSRVNNISTNHSKVTLRKNIDIDKCSGQGWCVWCATRNIVRLDAVPEHGSSLDRWFFSSGMSTGRERNL